MTRQETQALIEYSSEGGIGLGDRGSRRLTFCSINLNNRVVTLEVNTA